MLPAFPTLVATRLARRAALLLAILPLAGYADVAISIDPGAGRTRISPWIYGTNDVLPGVRFPLRRQGGNRMTGYNWENNASNAGRDYYHQSDDYLTWKDGITGEAGNVSGLVVTRFQDQLLAAGTRYSIVTLQMAGYVAADKSGRVTAAQAAPSSRWVAVENNKPTALSLTPDLTDGRVYSDELINLLLNRYGNAASARGVRAYSLDNEPDLWSNGEAAGGLVALTDTNGTHPLIHPAKTRVAELVTRSTALARTIKRMDPTAEVIGLSSYGFSGYRSFQDAPDWETERARGNYGWFLDYYLDQMRQASATAGQRLIDVMSLHYYSEANGGGHRVNATDYSDYTNAAWNEARMQAPRTLWDPTYREDSWIGQWQSAFLPLLPRVQQSIDAFYPGTKLMIGEYNFGGEGHVSGGLAQADMLGILGERGVYAGALWPFTGEHTYTVAAFKLFLDYDGAESRYGDTAVSATWADRATCSVHASAESGDPTRLHVIVLNKASTATTFDLSIAGTTRYQRARVYAFDAASATITERAAVATIANNRFSYAVPALTAAHFVLDATAVRADPWARQVEQASAAPFTAAANGATAYRWSRNGTDLGSATAATLSLANLQPADTGLYSVLATTAGGAVRSDPVLLGLASATKVVGGAVEFSPDVQHPNGNIYDQVLLTGAAAVVTVDHPLGQITRTSFIDLDDDIVQVEMSGPGTLSIVLDSPTGPALPARYNQNVSYMKGHAGIVITGADERTNLSVFSVGRITALNQALFRSDVTYDGIADIAFVAIATTNGRFGGLRTANAAYFARKGYTGVFAPGVEFNGPVLIGEISAFDTAQPLLVCGAATDTRVTGGSLQQPNGAAVRVSGVSQLRFVAGSDSHGTPLPAQRNQARFEQNGVDVTAQVVVD